MSDVERPPPGEQNEATSVPPQVFEPRDTRALFCPLRRTIRPLGLVSLHPPTQLSLGYPPSYVFRTRHEASLMPGIDAL